MEPFAHPISEQLRAVALALPETTEGTSCVNRAFKVRKKNFLFIGEKDGSVRLMLKLAGSLDDAEAMADPRVTVGTHGWTTLCFSPAEPLDTALLAAWVRESYSALAPKAVLKQLDG
jgi:hypothetical protein